MLDSEGEYDLTTANGRKTFRDQLNAAAYESDRLSTRVIPEAAELVKAGFVVVLTVFLVVSGVFWACGTRSRGPGAAPAA